MATSKKTPAKKVAAKKVAAKKVAAKKVAAKKVPAKKVVAKKVAAKKTTAWKPPAAKPVAKKTPATKAVAKKGSTSSRAPKAGSAAVLSGLAPIPGSFKTVQVSPDKAAGELVLTIDGTPETARQVLAEGETIALTVGVAPLTTLSVQDLQNLSNFLNDSGQLQLVVYVSCCPHTDPKPKA